MADQSDVENALVSAITNILYPNGLSSAGLLAQSVKIYRGWPNTASLRTRSGGGHAERDRVPESRHVTQHDALGGRRCVPTSSATPALTVSVSGNSATFAGSADVGQLAGLLVDATVGGAPDGDGRHAGAGGGGARRS